MRNVLTETFTVLRSLAKTGRDHIWGYYVRNLIRPIWLALPANRIDVLVGNPPWLRYSKMTSSMQERYLALARPRNLLSGPLGASGRDLATLFVARAVEKYLNPGGVFSFVMPHGTLTRMPHTGFRSGYWSSSTVGELAVQWGIPWDLNHAPYRFSHDFVRGHGNLRDARSSDGRYRRRMVLPKQENRSNVGADSTLDDYHRADQ